MRYLVRYSLGGYESEMSVSPDKDNPSEPDWDAFWSVMYDILYSREDGLYEPQHVDILDYEIIEE